MEWKSFAELLVEIVDCFVLKLSWCVLARQPHSPLDLEEKLGLVGRDLFHGQMTLYKLFVTRPGLGFANYRIPLEVLFLCSAGAHPVGGLSGLSGYGAAWEILRDSKVLIGVFSVSSAALAKGRQHDTWAGQFDSWHFR